MKKILKSNKNKIESLKVSYETKMGRVRDESATIIGKLSNVVVEQTNSKAVCLQLCEKKIEENKEKMECEIEEINCRHNIETVSLKNTIKEHEERRDRMEWIFGRHVDNPFIKNLSQISAEDLCEYFRQTQLIIQKSSTIRIIAEDEKKKQERISHDLKEEMADIKQQLDDAKDTILDLPHQNEDTSLELND